MIARYGDWIALASGLVLPVAFAPFYLGWSAPLSLAMLFLCWQDVSPRVAARRGMLYGTGAFLTGTYWLYISIHIFGNAPVLLALFLMLCLVLIKGAYHGLLGYVLVRFCRQQTAWFWLTLPAGWLLMEWLRGWLFGGFPWLSLGYSQTDTWLAGYAPVAGVYGVSLVVAFIAGLIAIILSTNWGAGGVNNRKPGFIALSALLSVLLAGAWLSSLQWTQADNITVRAALIQGAIPQDQKWLPEQREPTKALYLGLSREHWDADLVIWPEAAVPGLADRFEDYLSAVQIEAQQNNTEILLGILSIDRQNGRFSNSAMALTDTREFYFKRHLVPFGEYFPVPAFIREWMRLRNLPYVDFDAGDADQSPLTLAGQPVALSICYEDAYGAEQLVFLPQATLLVNISNDAWFGDSIAPHQHLQIARMRAIESGRYMLRATNTGVSAVIAADGTVEQMSPQFKPDVLVANIPPYRGATPYVITGNWLVVILAILMLLAAQVRYPLRPYGHDLQT